MVHRDMRSFQIKVAQPLYKDKGLMLMPISFQRDGMQLKPGLVVVEKQNIYVGATERIDLDFIKNHLDPDLQFLKDIYSQSSQLLLMTGSLYQ